MSSGGPGRQQALPSAVRPYRTIGPFDASSLPSGLRKTHRLAKGVWGRLELEEGAIRFVWEDLPGGAVELAAPSSLIIPPEVPHRVETKGNVRLRIGFHRA